MGPWFNICKTISRPSYLHNGISYTAKAASLYRTRALIDYHNSWLHTFSASPRCPSHDINLCCHGNPCRPASVNRTIIGLIHKSHNVPISFPIVHHFVTDMCTCEHITFTKWCYCVTFVYCIVGFVKWFYWFIITFIVHTPDEITTYIALRFIPYSLPRWAVQFVITTEIFVVVWSHNFIFSLEIYQLYDFRASYLSPGLSSFKPEALFHQVMSDETVAAFSVCNV